MTLIAKPHQVRGVAEVIQKFTAGARRLCLTSATGTGKTLMITDTIQWMVNAGGKVVLYDDPSVSYGGKLVGGVRVRALPKSQQAPPTYRQPAQQQANNALQNSPNLAAFNSGTARHRDHAFENVLAHPRCLSSCARTRAACSNSMAAPKREI